MGKFVDTLNANQKRTNNHAHARQAKAEIRARVLEFIGPTTAHVFDGFSGEGDMHRLVWHKAATYVGCDTEWYRDDRLVYVADNRRVLRSLDLRKFNVFDFDAWGSPWEQVLLVSARRGRLLPKERLGLVLTEGSGLAVKLASLPTALKLLTRVRMIPAGSAVWHDELIGMAIRGTAERMGAKVLKRWQANRGGGSSMRYIGLILEGM